MKLNAMARLAATGPGGNNSVDDFLQKMGMMAAGKIPVRSSNTDCRATVVRSLAHDLDKSAAIVIVGDDGHPVHTFTIGTEGQIVADAYAGGVYKNGLYSCTLSNGEHVDFKTLALVSVDDFIKNHVDPLQLHGHVVPRPDGVRAKCGGPNSVLQCAMCTREAALLAADIHPLKVEARKHFDDLPYKLEGLKFGFHSEEMMAAFLNFLGAVAWEGTAGHSCTVGLYVDGDGSDQMRVEGISSKLLKIGGEMARNACEQGDSLMVEISNATAAAYNGGTDNKYTRTVVYPELEPGVESKSDELERLSNEE